MKKFIPTKALATLLLSGVVALNGQAQTVDVDRTKYPDYSESINPDWSLMPSAKEARAQSRDRAVSGRPDHVHNGLNRHFPPVFNQDGGSCGSASRISYMFSYELAAYRNLDGSDPHNYYPSHFVWLHTNSPGQGKDEFVTKVGVPSAATYGGQTYSSLFGYQEETYNDFGWMQGYDKWYEAMHNRMLQPTNFPVSVGTEEGREAVKNWLWNHNGDDSFQAGGICGIGVASGGVWEAIPKTANNESIGVAGMSYVKQWGVQVDHALTIVGYDDRVEFDLDGDGKYGEPEADELGAWIIVNSWGTWWCNEGFVYCPYAYAGSAFRSDGTFNKQWWQPEIYKVRKDYRPLRTIKLEMDYSRRSEIALSAGVSADLDATEPEKTVSFIHFTYAGDGGNGNVNPAPEVPMLGRWADGKLHTEPMEFGYDLTDLSNGYDMSQPLKYFFIVDTRSWAEGKGTIHNASIIDYRFDELGVETPFAIGEGVEVKNAGEKTIISVVVQGSGYYKPQNATFADGVLTWQAPLRSANTIVAYNVYLNGAHVASLPADTYSYTPHTIPALGEYGVSAVYADETESDCIIARIPLVASEQNAAIKFNKAGFTIPDVMATHYEEATIEFWIKPTSLSYYNQTGGPGWGRFMFHTDAYGTFYAGWDTSNRATTAALSVGQWTHIAMVIKKNQLSIFVNGVNRTSCTSDSYSGVGGFGDLVFSSGVSAEQDAVYDEIRIWNTARTAKELKACMNTEFTGSIMPQGLVTYLKGDLITGKDGEPLIYDCVGGHHASIKGSYDVVIADMGELGAVAGNPSITINEPKGTIYAGIPTTLSATYSTSVNRIAWTVESAGIENVSVLSPTVSFATAGTHTVTAVAYTADGSSATATYDVVVAEAPEVVADFVMNAAQVPAGERIALHAKNPQVGYIYRWSMPGADVEEAASPSVATSYQAKGTYSVTLTVTAPDGREKSHTEQIEVLEVAPKAAFSIAPAVVIKGQEVEFVDESLYAPTKWEWRIGSEKANYILYDQYRALVMDQPGVYDVTLTVANNEGNSDVTRERALIVTNADSKNGLLFSYDGASVNVGMSPITAGQSAFTIDWWMNSAWLNTFCNGIGESDQTMHVKTNASGQMTLYVEGKSLSSGSNFVVPGEWHHYAVTFNSGLVSFYRDGVLNYSKSIASTAVPAISNFSIGTSGAPFKGSIDEFRVWGKALTDAQLRTYANSPIADVAAAESAHGLKLYYNFNQSGGDVQDATSRGLHGRRTGFGPDGDAWGLSKGVFCLNFSEAGGKDITATTLTNYVEAFASNNQTVNPNNSSRFLKLTGWTMENAVVNGNITTGAHVDVNKGRTFTVTTGWDGFANTLSNHKVFQTITLPKGYYTFEAEYDATYEGQCGASYLVVAEGSTLPVKEELGEAIAYKAMTPKGQVNKNTLGFVLTEETTVSIGLLVNMSGQSCMTLQRFRLMQSPVTIFEKSSDAVSSIAKLINDRLYYISLPYHTQGLTSWAVSQSEGVLVSNTTLGIVADRDDAIQQFAFLTNDEGATHYLYHALEKKFVNKDGKLADSPTDPVYFKEGAYDTTYVAYFDESHYINVNNERQLVINAYATPDGGNSFVIRPAKTFNSKAALEKFPIVEVAELTLNYSTATLMAGEALALQASIVPSYATDQTVTWTTSDNTVAIVARGVVTAVAPGVAVITAKAGDKEATCVVTVEKRYVEVMGILLSQSTATMTEGDELTLTATVLPEDADEKTITWETSNADIATVKDGVVTAIVPGTVTITAKAGGRQATCVVTVEKRYIPVTDIILNYTEVELKVGEKVTLSATVLPENADNKVITWSSSNVRVATISRKVVKAVAEGTAIITAKTADFSATCVVIVKTDTGIDQVDGETPTLMIYDVSGRPIKLTAKSTQELDPGVYIINGQKTVVK